MKKPTLIIIFLLFSSGFCFSQPANDNCPGITLIADTNCASINGTIAAGSFSGYAASCGGVPNHDVFYNFVATVAYNSITVTPCAAMDVVVQVYSGSCGGTSIGCFNNTGIGATEVCNLSGLIPGNTYWIRVYDFYGISSSCNTFNICVVTPPPPPVNDNCPGIIIHSHNTCIDTAGTLAGAFSSGYPATCGGIASHDVFYYFVAAFSSQTIFVTPCSTMRAVVEVYSGSCGGSSIFCNSGLAVGAPTSVTATGLTVGNTYWVRVYDFNGVSACNSFTICVHPPAPPPVVISITETPASCAGMCDGDATAAFTGGYGPFSYQWVGPSSFTSSLYTISGLCTGTYTFSVTDSFNMATYSSSAYIYEFFPSLVISAGNDTAICVGGTAVLDVSFNNGLLTGSCGLSITGLCPGTSISSVGTGLAFNSSYSYPSPFGNFYTSVVQQYLYTASELNTAGFAGGEIDQLQWNVSAISGISAYHNFSVSMGCTNLTALPAGILVSGLSTVLPAQTYTISTGWNSIVFPTGYIWDGVSNLIIQVCNSEGPPFPNYTTNSSVAYTTTTYVSSQWWLSDAMDQCAAATGFAATGLMHPDMRLLHCGAAGNASDFSFLWTPASGNIANDTMQSTTAMPDSSTSFVVTITDIATGCFRTDTINVTLNNCTVGLAMPVTGEETLNVYPNPATSELLISVPKSPTGDLGMGIKEIKIYNVLGEMVCQSPLTTHHSPLNIDISMLSKGIYFLCITSNSAMGSPKEGWYKFVKE